MSFRTCVTVSFLGLLLFGVAGCGGNSERVVQETEEWSYEDVRKSVGEESGN